MSKQDDEWGEIEPVGNDVVKATSGDDDWGEIEPAVKPAPTWESGDGGAETMPDGKTNQWGGNLRNEGRKVLLRRDKAGKVNGYSTTTSTLARDEDGKIAVIPTVVGGQALSPEDAVKHYAETGEHWGKADNEDDAKKMAQAVHEEHQKSYQKGWNDYIHDHWDEMSDEITKDRGVAYEHKKRTSPDKITLMERLANDDIEDELKKRDDAYNSKNIVTWDDWGREQITHPAKRDSATATMDDMAEIAKEAGLADWQVKRIRSESKTPEEMREALRYVAGNRPAKEGAEEQQQTAGWRSVPKTIVNTAGQMAAGFINLVGTALGGVDEEARHAFMADDPMAKKEGETFDSWLGRVGIDEKVKRMAKRNPAVRENLERYFKWEAPIAGKEGMHQEHSVMVQNGREGTGIGNEAIKGAKELRNWLNEKTPVGNSGSAVVDWLEGAASGIAQFAYLGPTMIATSAADSYQQTRSMALESGRSGDEAENIARGSAVFDGMMTAAFYYAPFRRWANGKGITPVQTVRNTSFSELSRGAGRFAAKREFLNQGIAAVEAGSIMGVQRAGDTAIQQFASGQDIDLGEITIEGAKGALDGVAIGAIMGAGRIINARIKGAKEYERRVRELIKTPEGARSFTQLYVDATADFMAEFERGGLPTKQQADKAGLPPMSAKERIEYAKLLRSQGITSEMLRRQSKIGTDATEGTEGAPTSGTPPAPPPEPVVDGETGEVITPSQAVAKKVRNEFGVEPVNFSIPKTADGKPNLVPMKWRDNKTGQENTCRLAYDPGTGVTIMEESDGLFSIHNDTGDSESASNLDEAVEKANELALMGQYTALDRKRKQQVIENERAEKYGNRNVAYFNTMADAAEAFENGIASEGNFMGLSNASQLRNPAVQDRDAFYTPDGTTVIILDNVQEVGDISRILAHEIVGHGGPNSEFGGRVGAQAVFAENIRAKEFEAFKQQVADGLFPKLRGTKEDVNRNLGEVFAHYASVNLDKEPSKFDKLVSAVNGAARKLGLRKTYSAADVRTMMAKWRDAARGTDGQPFNFSDGSPRFDFFPVEEQRTTTEVNDEAGNGTDEAPAQPESGAERPAEPEVPRPAEAGEAPADAGVVKRVSDVKPGEFFTYDGKEYYKNKDGEIVTVDVGDDGKIVEKPVARHFTGNEVLDAERDAKHSATVKPRPAEGAEASGEATGTVATVDNLNPWLKAASVALAENGSNPDDPGHRLKSASKEELVAAQNEIVKALNDPTPENYERFVSKMGLHGCRIQSIQAFKDEWKRLHPEVDLNNTQLALAKKRALLEAEIENARENLSFHPNSKHWQEVLQEAKQKLAEFMAAHPDAMPIEKRGAKTDTVPNDKAPGAAEPRRLTSAEEVVATAKTPFSEVEKKALEDAADVSAIDATDEMPPQTDFLSILSKDAPVVRLNPAKVDRSDAVLPNMKKDANRTSGITKPLSGEWHPTMGGIGAVWLTKDGKLVVITGRHRSELAERKGKSMLYYLYREADGFTKEDALIYDAVANIHDEKGTINDYLGFLDRINPTREQAEKAGILSGKGLVAWSLYKDATEAVRSATAMDGNPGEGQISPQQATVIAQAAPRDADKRNPSIQRQLLRTALGGMRGKAFDMYARIRAEELSKTPVNENLLAGEQMDLFSSPEDQAADILAQRQSQYRTKKAQGYQTVAQNLRAALNKEGKLELTDEYVKDLGVTDKSDKKQLEAAYEKAVERANYWENAVRLDDADKTAMDAEINAAADARAEKLAELKAKREAAKSGKPVPKPKTETPAAVQKPDISTFVKAQREAEADDDFEGDRGLADLIESLPPESAQKLISLWNESDRLDSEADKLVDEHGRLTRFNQTKFDSDENERKYGDLRARARDLQNEAHNMLLREAEANGWEQGDDAETGNVRWVKKPAQKSAPSTDDAKMARSKAAAEKHVVSYGNGMKGTLADMIKNGAATLYPAKGLTIFDKGAHVVTIGFEQFKPTNDELPYLAKLQQERDAAEPAKTAPVSVPPKTEATTPPKAEKPVEGRKSSDTAKPAAKTRQPSIKMKDEAAEKLAQKQEDDLAALFDTPELGIIDGDEGKHRLRGRPSGLVDKLFHPFSSFLSSRHGVEIDRRNGTPIGIGIVRDAFEAFAPDEEQRALASTLFDVAEKLGVDFRIDHRQPADPRNEQAYEIGGHITLHADELDKRFGKDVCNAILHEIAHGVTSYAINISENEGGVEGVAMPHALHDAVRRLRAAFRANRDLLPGNDDYKNLHEFAARLTEPGFREKLERRGWFRRIIDAIVDMFKALFGKPKTARANAEYDRAIKALRGIVENYDKTAFDVNRAAAEDALVNPNFSIRKEAPPKKTGVGYKVFVRGKDGKLYPPMVNPTGEATPEGVWLNADEGVRAGKSKTGRDKVKAGGKGTNGGSGSLAYRPGWHLGKIPYALQFNIGPKVPNPLGIRNQKGEVIKVGEFFPANFVWGEVEYAADVDYQDEAMSYGRTEKGAFNHALAGLPRIPTDGSYEYRTNANPATDPWIITGAMKVNRILSNDEVDSLVRAAGREPQKRESEAVQKFLAWAKKWKLDPSKESVRKEWEERNGVSFDTPEFDPDIFQKRVGAVAKLVKTYQDNGVADFKTLATRMAERFPEKFAAMKPYLRGVWNAVADQMNLSDVSRGDAERIYGTIEAQAKEGTNGPGEHGDNGGVRATADGGERPGGVLAGGQVRPENPDGRVGGVGTGDVPGQHVGLAETGTPQAQPSGGSGTSGGTEPVADRAGHPDGKREAGGDSETAGHEPKPRVKKPAAKAADKTKVNPSRRDFVMTKAVEDAILEKKTVQRVRNNLAAINLIRELKARDYAATPAEQETLAKFVGWGGLREDVFSYDLERAYNLERSGDIEFAQNILRRNNISKSAYELHKELRQVLNDEEYEAAKASSSTAFYTPIDFVRVLHDALRNIGVKGGRFLGPSAGVGNFASASGEYEKPVNWQFVEKDIITGEILKALFPNQRVTVGGFEETKFPDGFFDFAIDNVPYADVPINDRTLSSKMFKIHDYFFAKTLAKLRPGGVMAFLTSTGTLDKTSPILRQFLTEHGGKIVGAVRLPNGFFADNAGTDVASDLVIVQKVEGKPDNSAFERGEQYGTTTEWVKRKGQVKKPLTYNGYFKDNPGQVIGKMEVASGQFGPTLRYTMPEGDLLTSISGAIDRALDGIDRDALLKSASVAEPKERKPIYDDEGLRQGNVTMKDGKPFIKSGEMLEPITLPNDRALAKELGKRFRTPKGIMEGLVGLRKAMRDVIDAQMADDDTMETDLAPLLAKLNEVYDAFVKKNGTLHDKWVSPFVLLDKADGNRMLALERIVKDENGKPKVVKSDIFSKRVISRGQRATKAETPKDALVISYSETGAINIPRIAELLGVSEDEAVAKLKESGDAFENPQTGRLEPSWQYLSGRVRAKLAAARAAVEAGEESYRANIEALEKVQPPMVRLEDAEIKFGATWVDTECMKDFLRDAFGSEHIDIEFVKNEVTGEWNLPYVNAHIMNADPWGETSWGPIEFIKRVLNHGSMNHYVTDPVDKKRYLDERRTEANKLAAEKLHSAFSQFILSSEKWAAPCYERYNAVMTDMVEIKLPNNILPFRASGMTEATLGKLFEDGDPNRPKKGREYQSAVIARGVLGGDSLCLAHCVGAGKTLEMQSIGVLGRHLGMFKKPMYVVPNHMLEQFTNEFVEAFPNANILKMSEDDVKPENRRAFFAQVANGDWDAIVVKHSTFSKKLGMSSEYQRQFLEAQIRDLEEVIEAMRESGEKISVDQANKKKERLEAKLEQLANAENHDSQIVPFEELGVDQLFVDEAHNFKGMPISTSQGRTGGLSQGDSQRAIDMQMKTEYVQSLHGGDRGVVFATGTPLSNAPVVEAYVMLKYLAPKKLQEQGLSHFDDFVSAFGRITTESEFSLDGKTVKEKDKVSAFVNIPELMKLFRSAVDIVNPDQLDIPRPKPKYHMIDVDMTPTQAKIMEMVAHEAMIPGGREHPNKFLDLSAIAKMACLTPRILGYADGGNKIIRAISEIKKVYDETSDNRGAQLVFTDIFNESETRGDATDAYILKRTQFDGEGIEDDDVLKKRDDGKKYNLNEEIRDLLIAAGVPKEEIAIIQDIDKSKGDKDANKSALFAKVRSGEVRILIGSRPKMGEGTNVQERLAAIHLLHPGWKPAEDEQAIGRIIRFGNSYKEAQIFYYLTKGNANVGSYETKNHQLIGVKSKLIDQVMHGDETVREIDMDESAMDRDMLMGLASGNKALMELIDVKKRVHKLELNTESTATSARRNKDRAEANARILERKREEFAKEQDGVTEWREKNEGKPFALSTPDGRSLEKVKDMADYIAAQMVKQLTQDRYDRSERTVLGNFNGVEMVLAYDKWGDEKFRLAVPLLGVSREINYSGFIPDFSQNAMTAFKGRIFETVSPDYAKAYENQLADMDKQAKKMLADADRLQKDYEQMRDELIKLRARQAELERAVTPLMIQTVADHKQATYGNWVIKKEGGKYNAWRDKDGSVVSAKTVKELIPLMDEADFASPRYAATKTADIRPLLKPDSKGTLPEVHTVPVSKVDFDTPDLSPAEEAYGEAEDKTPTEKVMREVYGMTNDEIATALKAAGMEPPKHVRKPDETAWQQAEALLSNPSYMAKLSRAVAKFPRNIADYENNALNVLFRQRQAAVNEAQTVVDGLKETLDAFDAIPKEERDTDFNAERQKTVQDYTEAKAKLAQAKALMYETGLALTRSSSEAGRRLRSNRGLIDQTDYSYAGLSGQVAAILGGADKITPEMDARIREIAGDFASLDEQGRELATARLKAQAEKIVQQIKSGDKVRKATERKPGDEARRVTRNYNDALAQIEVGSAEVGGTLIGLSDQQYPAWGKWLRALGEYHCFENPDITEEECIKAIVEDISPFMDGVDENQVRDALTGFGHNFKQSRFDSQRLMNDLRSQARLKRQLDWMDETNTMPPLTGMVRDEPSDTTRNLQKQVQERKKEVPDAGRDERRLKGVLDSAKTRVKNRIADLESAIATGEKIPGRERTVPEDMELRALRQRRDELQKAYDELFKTERGLTDEQRVKLAERLLSRELEHALEDLDRARSGDFSKRPKRPGVESPSLDALRERLAEVRSQIRELKNAKYEFGMTPEELSAYNARKMANREKAVARLAERIVSGDIRPQKKPKPPMSEEMQKRYDELAEQMNRAHRKLNDLRREAADARKPKFVRFIGDAYRFVDGVWKMATASLDFTQVGNQTGTILMAHPKLVAENFVRTLKAFTSTTNAENIELDLLSDESVKEAVDNGWLHWKKISDANNRGERVELFDAIDKPFTIGGKAIRFTDIPGYGTLIANSDRLYATYINAASASLYSTIINDPKLFPGGASVFQKKMLCDMINVMNGSGSLSKGARRYAGKVFWAPGLVDSQLKRLIGYQIWHPWTASGEEDGSGTFKERATMSRIGLGEFVKSNLGAILLGGLLFSLLATDDQKDEYAHAGLVKKLQMMIAPRIRHTQFDFTGGSAAFLRLGNRLVTGAYETAKGKTAKVRDTFSEVAHFAKGRLTPLVSNFFSWMSGKDYTGQDYGAAELIESFAPISIREAGKSIYENGIEDRAWGTALLGSILTMFGLGKGSYRKDDYAILSNRFLESKKEFDAIESDDLIDEDNKKLMLDSIVSENPLMRDEVRDEIAADIARIRKDEAKARKDEKEGNEPDAELLSEIEAGKRNLIEKIRSARRK